MSTKVYAQRHKELGLCRNCPNPLANGSSIFCTYHREKDKIHNSRTGKKIAIRLKKECIDYYGGKCECCGESLMGFLTIDHKLGKGNEHRKSLFGYNVGGVKMYRWLKKNNFPKGYEVLCMNCNWGKRYSAVCPHKLER